MLHMACDNQQHETNDIIIMTVLHLHLVSFVWSMSICFCFVNTTLEGLPTLDFVTVTVM
jgi:hypothetical protein